MALKPKMLRIVLNKGLSTETDSKTIVPGELDDLRNGVFTHATTISKRWGNQPLDRTKSDLTYDAIAGARGGGNRAGDTVLVTDEDELVSFTERGWSKRADLVPLRQSSKAIARGPFRQYDQDHALAPNGVRLFTWADGRGGVRYRLFDSIPGSDELVAVAGEQQLSGHPTRMVRSLVVGTSFHMYFASGSTLNVASLPYSTPTAAPSFIQIATDLAQDAGAYDVIVRQNANSVLAWRNAASVTTIGYVRPAGNVGVSGTFPSLPTQVSITGTEAGPALSLTDDGNRIVLAYGTRDSGALIRSAVYNASTLAIVQNSVVDRVSGSIGVTTGSIRGLTVVTDGGSTSASPFPFTVLYEVSASNPVERFVRFGRTTSTGSAPISSGTFRLQSSVASHAFKCDGDGYVWLTYPSPNQRTDFMYRVPDGKLCAVSRYAEADLNVSGVLGRPQVTGTVSYRAAPFREQLPTTAVSASAFLDTSTRLLTTHIHRSGAYSPVDVEGRLFNGGGYLGVYDGTSHVESGFHLLSEPLTLAIAGSSSAGGLTGQVGGLSGTYSYLAVPSWTDSFGDTVRGYPVQGTQAITLSAVSNRVAITGTMLVHTDKDGTRADPLRWEVYRTLVSDATVWQRLDDPNSPILNSTGSTYWTFLDTLPDGQLAVKQPFYAVPFGGAEAGNVNPPAPSVLSLSGDSLHVAGCEGEPLTVFHSKLRLGGPVRFGLGAESGVDPVGGAVSALAALDDRLIVFKPDRVYVLDGFPQSNLAADPTPFPVPRLLTSQVGCQENHTIVTVAGERAQGLMFKSSKGIWLLGRNEAVSDIGGHGVRRFDGLTIVAAVADPLTQQVRFHSSEGTTLVYDARFLEWSRFTGQPAVDAFVHRGKCAFVDSRGRVYVETPGSYLDGSNPVAMYIELGWLSFDGLQGLHRVYGIQMIGNRISDHTFRVGFARNYVPGWTYVDIATSSSMGGTGYGDGHYGGMLTASMSGAAAYLNVGTFGPSHAPIVRYLVTGSVGNGHEVGFNSAAPFGIPDNTLLEGPGFSNFYYETGVSTVLDYENALSGSQYLRIATASIDPRPAYAFTADDSIIVGGPVVKYFTNGGSGYALNFAVGVVNQGTITDGPGFQSTFGFVPDVTTAHDFENRITSSSAFIRIASGSTNPNQTIPIFQDGAGVQLDLGSTGYLQTISADSTDNLAGGYDGVFLTADPVYGGGGDSVFQHDINTPYQRVQSLKLSFSDPFSTGSYGGFELTEVALEVGMDRQKAETPGRKRF